MKGGRLVEGAYEPQPVVESLDGTLILRSETLGLDLRVKGEEMYFLDPATGQRLLGHREANAAYLAAESRAEREAAARRTAEARAAVAESRAAAAEARLAELEALAAGKR